jgi:hypothetical protein
VKSGAATGKRKGRVGGAAMMAWMFFANLFDPKKVAAMEQIDTANRVGNPALRAAAADHHARVSDGGSGK